MTLTVSGSCFTALEDSVAPCITATVNVFIFGVGCLRLVDTAKAGLNNCAAFVNLFMAMPLLSVSGSI